MEEQGTIVREGVPEPHSLYFKCLKRKEAGFGVAICRREDDKLLFQMKGSVHDSRGMTILEAELMTLKQGLAEAVTLGITNISICCDNYKIFELIMGRRSCATEKDNIASLVDDVQRIRQQLASSTPVLVTVNRAYKLAMETMVSEISIHMPKKSCSICFEDDFEADEMFSVALCHHEFCVECVKRYLEVRVLEGSVTHRCPHHGCDSNLTFGSSAQLLTPKLRQMWEQRIKEDSVPPRDRYYCPNPVCSALMSKTEGARCCLECGLHLDSTQHNEDEDGKLKALAKLKKWRQCGKCGHMIERLQGCKHVICRCGYSFCYLCGKKWRGDCFCYDRGRCIGYLLFAVLVLVVFVDCVYELILALIEMF